MHRCRYSIVTTAIVEKLVLELDEALYKAFETFAKLVAEAIRGLPGREQPPVQASGDLVEIYNHAAAIRPHFEEVWHTLFCSNCAKHIVVIITTINVNINTTMIVVLQVTHFTSSICCVF